MLVRYVLHLDTDLEMGAAAHWISASTSRCKVQYRSSPGRILLPLVQDILLVGSLFPIHVRILHVFFKIFCMVDLQGWPPILASPLRTDLVGSFCIMVFPDVSW